jgi:hypothetical protein
VGVGVVDADVIIEGLGEGFGAGLLEELAQMAAVARRARERAAIRILTSVPGFLGGRRRDPSKMCSESPPIPGG